jgi:hypothetical protein
MDIFRVRDGKLVEHWTHMDFEAPRADAPARIGAVPNERVPLFVLRRANFTSVDHLRSKVLHFIAYLNPRWPSPSSGPSSGIRCMQDRIRSGLIYAGLY